MVFTIASQPWATRSHVILIVTVSKLVINKSSLKKSSLLFGNLQCTLFKILRERPKRYKFCQESIWQLSVMGCSTITDSEGGEIVEKKVNGFSNCSSLCYYRIIKAVFIDFIVVQTTVQGIATPQS